MSFGEQSETSPLFFIVPSALVLIDGEEACRCCVLLPCCALLPWYAVVGGGHATAVVRCTRSERTTHSIIELPLLDV